jgi:hypothetical protein
MIDENDMKGRIMNILNYRKPKFWIVVVAMISVAAIIVVFVSNPQKELWTIEDYAIQFVQEQIKSLENEGQANFRIIDSRITKFDKISTFDSIHTYPLEIWSLQYLLKPDDISKVMLAGGMNEIDGWITEDSSMGKPMLIFSYKSTEPEYLGCIWSGEVDYNGIGFNTVAGQETALRMFLEGKGLLPHETYKGNHILVKFPLSTGETCQLLLSQPVVQGVSGIWCVERWMDGNGNVYYVTPKVEGMISNHYKELQNQFDNGNKTWLTDPMQVALDWIYNDLGQKVSPDDIVTNYSANAEDFLKAPESHFIGYISKFESDKPNPAFHLDQIEWLTLDDTKRLKELNVDPNDLPNGFYIHNPNSYPMYCQVTDETQYSIIALEVEVTQKSVTIDEFIEYLEQFEEYSPPFRIISKDGYVQSITEQYVP